MSIQTLSERLSRYHKFFLLSPLLFILIFFFAGPLMWLFRVSLYQSRGSSGFGIGGAEGKEGGGFYVEGTWTLENYFKFFQDDYFVDIMFFTIKLAVIVTVVTMLVSYPMAYYIYKAGAKLKTFLLIIVILPKLSNMLVLVYGLQILMANNGWVNKALIGLGIIDEPVKLVYTLFSDVVAKVLLIAPYTILVITAALHGLDRTLRDAAMGLGASGTRAFLTITFPLSLPGSYVALLITIVWALGAFVSPLLLGNPDLQTLAVEVPKQTFENVNWAMGSAIAFIVLGLMFIVVLIFNLIVSSAIKWRTV